MKELAWVFGKSSKFSEQIINEFEKNDITVVSFGRENINYNQFNNLLMIKIFHHCLTLNAYNNVLLIFCYFLYLLHQLETY